jgi:hypothetical protein
MSADVTSRPVNASSSQMLSSRPVFGYRAGSVSSLLPMSPIVSSAEARRCSLTAAMIEGPHESAHSHRMCHDQRW